MKNINLMRVLALPGVLSQNLLYLLKKSSGGLNVWMSDKSGTRPAVAYREVRLTGPEEVFPSVAGTPTTAVYNIANYDMNKTYAVSVSAGSVAVNGKLVTFTAPLVAGDVYLTINGEHSKIRVRPVGVKKAEILFPYFEGTVLRPSFTVKLSPYAVSSGNDVCLRTDIRTSPVADFSSGVTSYSQGGAAPNMLVTDAVPEKLLYMQARYVGTTYGPGDWSKAISLSIEDWIYPVTEVARLKPLDAAAGDSFGNSVAVSGDGSVLLVGARQDVDKGLNSGSAYIYQRVNSIWRQLVKLVATDGVAGDGFGECVALNALGNVAVVSAPNKEAGKGAVYVFKIVNDAWTQSAKLTATGGLAGDYFGSSLAMNAAGTVILVASADTNNIHTAGGNVYFFAWSGTAWVQRQKLVAADPNLTTGFGVSMSLNTDGNVAAIGSASDANGGTLRGSVFIFVENGGIWTQQARLSSSDLANNDRFGSCVSLNGDGDVLAVSSPGAGSSKGAIYVFTRAGTVWTQQAKKVADDGVAGDGFGTALALVDQGDMLVVSSPLAKTANVAKGAIYSFKGVAGVWTQLSKLKGSVSLAGDGFGNKLTISQKAEAVVVGSSGSDDGGADSGSVYIFG